MSLSHSRRFWFLLVCSTLVGCMGGGDRSASPGAPAEMESPYSSYAERDSDPFTTVRVFYGTNRAPARNSTEWEDYYGTTPASLEIGRCDVSIPASHEYGEVERPSIWKLEFSENPSKHVVLQSVMPMSQEKFLRDLRGDVEQSGRKEAFVFIHGFNVSFADAARRTAQMAYDLEFDGPPIFYSWPSRGEVTGYVADMTAAEASIEPLQQFLEGVALQSGAREVHLIAHSMGNRVLTNALDRIAQAGQYREVPRFNEILLAAPDIDANTFRTQIAPRITNAADRITIYASSDDKALLLSQKIHDTPRLGQGGSELTLFPDLKSINVIDSLGIDFSLFELGHSSYGKELLQDVRLTLDGVSVEQRQLKPHPSGLAWLVPYGNSLTPVSYEEPDDFEPDGSTNIPLNKDDFSDMNEEEPKRGFWSWMRNLWPW